MKEKSNTKRTTLWICLTAMFMALNVAMSSFGVPVPRQSVYLQHPGIRRYEASFPDSSGGRRRSRRYAPVLEVRSVQAL